MIQVQKSLAGNDLGNLSATLTQLTDYAISAL